MSDSELRRWVLSGRIVRHIWRYESGCLLTERLGTAGRPMLAWVLWGICRGPCRIADLSGGKREIALPVLLRWSFQLALELLRKPALLRRVERAVEAVRPRIRAATPAIDPSGRVLYLRTDMSFGVRAGGSVGHIAGVLNELASRGGGSPLLLTTADVPTLRAAIDVHHVHVPEAFWNFKELPTFVLDDVVYGDAVRLTDGQRVSFVYQRYSLNNYAGLRIARRLGVPFILEYNGSEIWMARHWGHPLTYEALSTRIELLNLHAADLVVVVSRAMQEELRDRGIDAGRILVNPNAVDADRYSPDIDGTGVLDRFGWRGKIVVGFIGTFGPWHGAHVLARAFVRLLNARPEYRGMVRLLMIGDGAGRGATQEIITSAKCGDIAAFTGLVPQEDGPRYLAACDVLASPHVPNPDGSPFFGSPTKLFEYMAMGKAIVASELDQIGEVLRHGQTAWLVPPGDVAALVGALERLIDDPQLRGTLGEAARRDAVTHHTWRAHVEKTLAALTGRVELAS